MNKACPNFYKLCLYNVCACSRQRYARDQLRVCLPKAQSIKSIYAEFWIRVLCYSNRILEIFHQFPHQAWSQKWTTVMNTWIEDVSHIALSDFIAHLSQEGIHGERRVDVAFLVLWMRHVQLVGPVPSLTHVLEQLGWGKKDLELRGGIKWRGGPSTS